MRTPAVDVRKDDNPKCGQWFLCTWKVYTYSEIVHQQWVVDATPNRQLRELIYWGSMVSSGMAAHDVESPFRSCPFQITPTTISPTHHWSRLIPATSLDWFSGSKCRWGGNWLFIICYYIIINIILIQSGMFMNVPHIHPLAIRLESRVPVGATRVFLSSSVASTVGIQWPFSLRPLFTVCICRCPSMTISWTEKRWGTQKAGEMGQSI